MERPSEALGRGSLLLRPPLSLERMSTVLFSIDDLRPSTIRPPTLAAVSSSAVGAEHVHTLQVEVPRGLQHVAVVRIDLLKAMLLGARQVQRVVGSEEDRATNLEDGGASLTGVLARQLPAAEVAGAGRSLAASVSDENTRPSYPRSTTSRSRARYFGAPPL